MPKTPHEVLEFWFSDQMRPYWFAKSDDIDRDIAARFSDTYEAAHAGRLDDWMDAPDSALALVIVLDQFPRNMFRDDPRAFATDALALRIADRAIAQGHDLATPEPGRQFFYMPFEHAEDMADQRRAVALFAERMPGENLRHAQIHRDTIARFGRFPHRNQALGRETTPEEQAFLDQDGFTG